MHLFDLVAFVSPLEAVTFPPHPIFSIFQVPFGSFQHQSVFTFHALITITVIIHQIIVFICLKILFAFLATISVFLRTFFALIPIFCAVFGVPPLAEFVIPTEFDAVLIPVHPFSYHALKAFGLHAVVSAGFYFCTIN